MPDPMTAVARLRHLAVDEAMRALSACVTAETEAASALATLEAAIKAETEAAEAAGTDDLAVEAFGRWLRQATAQRTALEAALVRAETQSAEARAVLASSRAEARAVDELRARQAADRQTEAARREQAVLDEAGTAKWMTER